MNFPSKLVENAVEHLSRLPGIGKRSALRLVLHMLKQEKNSVEQVLINLHKSENMRK
jgi:recombination protein RecR